MFVEPSCVTWTGMEVYPRFLQRGGIDAATYVSQYDFFDPYPVQHIEIDYYSQTEYEDLTWLDPSVWQSVYTQRWFQEIILVLVAIGASKISPHMIEVMNYGISSFQQAPCEYLDDIDETSVAMSSSVSESNVQNFFRYEHSIPSVRTRYDYLEHGPNSIDDWYTEIGWILGAHGVTEMRPGILNWFNKSIAYYVF